MAIDKVVSASITTDAVGPTQLNEAANYDFTGTVTGAGVTNTPSFMAANSGGQTLTNSATNVLAGNSEIYDSDSAYDNSSYRFTVPSGKGGKYLFGLGCQFETNAAGRMDNFALRIRVNGSTVIDAADYPGGSTENRIPYKYTSGILNLSAADTISYYVYQNSGDSQNLTNAGLYMFKLIGA